jgi:hypothetical protein
MIHSELSVTFASPEGKITLRSTGAAGFGPLLKLEAGDRVLELRIDAADVTAFANALKRVSEFQPAPYQLKVVA